MREISIEEVKEIQLRILIDVQKFCIHNNLRYYLAGGTLLGAIRHKGFIPWDDDIDIIMPRKDYMIFNKMYNYKNDRYKVHSVFNDNEWGSTFAVVEDVRTKKIYDDFNNSYDIGVCIDVFPTDGSPNNLFERRIYWNILNFFSRIAILSVQKFKVSRHYVDRETVCGELKTYLRTVIKFLAIPIARLTKTINLNLLINKIAMKFDVDESKYIGVSTFPHYGYKECVEATGFLKIEKRMFEGELFNTPYNYDEYLSNLYGDYMKIPPKEKQVSHHNFKAYWKDEL